MLSQSGGFRITLDSPTFPLALVELRGLAAGRGETEVLEEVKDE